MTVALSGSRALWMIVTPGVTVIMTVIMVITMVMTIVAAIVIVVASVFVMRGEGRPFGFFSVSVSIHHLYQLDNGGRPLAVQLAMKLLVSEPFREGSDGLEIGDVGHDVSCLREAPDEVM